MSRPLRGALRYFYLHDGFFLAAGLSFYIVVCLVPLLLLLVAGGGYLLSDDMVAREVLDRLAATVPVYQSEMEDLLRGVVAARGVSSLVGTVILVLFASQLFAATRLVLNRIFGTKGRGLIHGAVFDVWMILVITLLFLGSVGLTAGLAWLRGALGAGQEERLLAVLFEWVGLGVGVALNTTLCAVLYRFVPLRRVAWPSVLRGSVAAASLWEAAKQVFRWYILGTGLYGSVYGSVGVAIALVMWVYYSAIVFVLGAALIRGLEDGRGEARASDAV